MKKKKAKLLSLVGVFRKMTWKKKKQQNRFEKALIKPYIYDAHNKEYAMLSKDKEKRVQYRGKNNT
jgi:hypothetical protein